MRMILTISALALLLTGYAHDPNYGRNAGWDAGWHHGMHQGWQRHHGWERHHNRW